VDGVHGDSRVAGLAGAPGALLREREQHCRRSAGAVVLVEVGVVAHRRHEARSLRVDARRAERVECRAVEDQVDVERRSARAVDLERARQRDRRFSGAGELGADGGARAVEPSGPPAARPRGRTASVRKTARPGSAGGRTVGTPGGQASRDDRIRAETRPAGGSRQVDAGDMANGGAR
jgi:hypothetical protein